MDSGGWLILHERYTHIPIHITQCPATGSHRPFTVTEHKFFEYTKSILLVVIMSKKPKTMATECHDVTLDTENGKSLRQNSHAIMQNTFEHQCQTLICTFYVSLAISGPNLQVTAIFDNLKSRHSCIPLVICMWPTLLCVPVSSTAELDDHNIGQITKTWNVSTTAALIAPRGSKQSPSFILNHQLNLTNLLFIQYLWCIFQI